MNSIGERKFAFFYYSTNTIIYHEYRLLRGLLKEKTWYRDLFLLCDHQVLDVVSTISGELEFC